MPTGGATSGTERMLPYKYMKFSLIESFFLFLYALIGQGTTTGMHICVEIKLIIRTCLAL